MSLTEIGIHGYRSIRDLRMPLRRLTVLVGANGVGKTNLYRSLELLHAAATGRLADEIAGEGGLGSVFWAGGKNLTPDGRFDPMHRTDGYRKGDGPARVKLDVTLDDVFEDGEAASYAVEVGFPQPFVSAAFPTEAQIKREVVTVNRNGGAVTMLEREGQAARIRDSSGKRTLVTEALMASETALSSLQGAYPTLDAVRHVLSAWRFYHGFRTDRESPLRRPALAVTSPLLSADGANLAAVFATLRHIREESVDLDDAIEAAFPGARLNVPIPEGSASFSLTFPDVPKRAFGAAELSDGTLHFLALMGALLSYRLPPFIALNEPETSLHPDLLPALAKIIGRAAARTQIWVVTHSEPLADALAAETGVVVRRVIRREGNTWIEGLTQFASFEDE